MLSDLETGFGLDVVIWLQHHSSGALDWLAQALDVAGTVWFYIPAILVIALFWDRGMAWRLGLAVILVTVTSEVIKELAGRPRPFQVDPEQVRLLVGHPNSNGLPSGHVSTALVFWGLVALRLRRAWIWVVVACYVALVGWARMVGGVHYPQDVLGGLLLGSLFLWGFGHFLPKTPSQGTPQ